jgi:hypothetical protein
MDERKSVSMNSLATRSQFFSTKHTYRLKPAKWYGRKDVRSENVSEPSAPLPGQEQVKVAWCGICGLLHEKGKQ